MFGSKDLLFSSETYGVAKSLRFRGGQYLSRTPASNGDRQKFTWSGWVKRGALSSSTPQVLFSAYNNSGTTDSDWFRVFYVGSAGGASTDALQIDGYVTLWLRSSALYRDSSAWHHVVVAVDTTSSTTTITGTSTDRIRLYINGAQITAFNTANAPTQDLNTAVNSTSYQNRIGSINFTSTPGYLDGYMAEVNFIDGQALTPSSFGLYDNNGIWQPKGYTGTYGTNGFYLKFTDVGATSGSNTGYGKDFSGFNTNYWTTNNFGTTSTNVDYDSMLDSPTNAAGDIGNYCVVSPINSYSTITISNANLTATLTEAAYRKAVSTMAFPSSGKYYVETKLTGINYASYGVVTPTAPLNDRVGATATGYGVVTGGSQWDKWDNGTSTGNFWNISTTSPTLQIAIDTTNGKLWIGYNDTWLDGSGGLTGNPAAGTNATFTIDTSRVYLPAMGGYKSDAIVFDFNAGQRPFSYTPPSGFSALNTQNLTTPTITNGAAYMAAVTYTGSASTQSVTATSTNSGNNPNAVTFQPDLVWIKDRTNAQSHKLTDAVRGTTKAISTDSTAAEATDANGVTAFNNNGFSLGTGTRAYSDSNLDSYVAWQWKEGVSQGFDIVSYAGDNTSNRNISHNLGVAPVFVWVKSLSTGSFYIYHQNLTGSTYFLKCNSTDGTNAQTNTNTPWGTANWSSTQFMVTNNATNNLNASSTNYISYLWAAVAGYSAFGSYTGNGSTDGPFVFTGFRPRFVLIKRTDTTESWLILDTSRDTYNQANNNLYPNLSNAESTSGSADLLSNGFKLRSTTGGGNSSTGTYIYAAFAENPFKISRAR